MQTRLETHTDNVESYVGIPIDTIAHFKILPFDLYICISPGRYSKRISAYEEIEKLTIQNLKSKGVKEIHFDVRHKNDFGQILLNNLMNEIDKDYIFFKEHLQVRSKGHQKAEDIVRDLGLSSRVITICENAIAEMIRDLSSSHDQFSKYLNVLLKSKKSFHYQLIELTSYLTIDMIDSLDALATEDYAKRMIFAAFFCDITLKNPDWIHIRSSHQFKGLSQQSIKEINMHALKSAELVSNYKNAPAGTDFIIRQHHGSRNGLCFKEEHDENISSLAKCLVVAQDLAYVILTNPNQDIRESVEEILFKHRHVNITDSLRKFGLNPQVQYKKRITG